MKPGYECTAGTFHFGGRHMTTLEEKGVQVANIYTSPSSSSTEAYRERMGGGEDRSRAFGDTPLLHNITTTTRKINEDEANDSPLSVTCDSTRDSNPRLKFPDSEYTPGSCSVESR